MMSRRRSAVVAGSTATSFSSGGGGATALAQSEMTSASDGEAVSAAISALAAAKRSGVMVSSRFVGDGAECCRMS
jgi:hypothetical protein